MQSFWERRGVDAHLLITTVDEKDVEEPPLGRRPVFAHLQPELELRPQQAVPLAASARLR